MCGGRVGGMGHKKEMAQSNERWYDRNGASLLHWLLAALAEAVDKIVAELVRWVEAASKMGLPLEPEAMRAKEEDPSGR